MSGTWHLDGDSLTLRQKMSTSRLGRLYATFPVVGSWINMAYDALNIGPEETGRISHLCETHLRFNNAEHWFVRKTS